MPTYVVKPALAGGNRTQSGETVTGAASAVAALSDGSDASYLRLQSASLPADFEYNGWPAGIVGTERVVSVALTMRAKNAGAQPASVSVGDYQSPNVLYEGVVLAVPAGQAAITTLAQLAQQGQYTPPGQPSSDWSSSYWPTLSIRDPNASALWYDASWTYYTLKPASIAAPTIAPTTGGTNTTSAYPTLSAVVSALVESWQVWAGGEFVTTGRVEFSVYNAADATGASPPVGVQPVALQVVPFDLNTYIDGVTLSTLAASFKLTTPLPDGNYAVYARAVRDHPSGSDVGRGVSAWTAYQKATWSQLIGAPQAPGAGYAADAAGQGIVIHAYLSAPAAYTQSSGLAYVERLVGGVWRAVRGMTAAVVPAAGDHTLGEDFECDRTITNTYRIRSSYVNATDGTLAYSPWTTFTVAGPVPLGTGWNLKAVNLIASSWLGAGALTEPTESDQTQATIFYPLDRPCPVVVKGTAGGWSGSYDFIANGAAAVAAVRALTDYEGLVLVETAFGDTFYCSLTGMTVKRQGTSAAPRLAGTLTFTQVDCDLATES